LTNNATIMAEIRQLQHIGYTEEHISQIITLYSGGYPSWQDLSANQQRRLAEDLRRYGRIARKWHFSLTGCFD
jgi:hypothetical protein